MFVEDVRHYDDQRLEKAFRECIADLIKANFDWLKY